MLVETLITLAHVSTGTVALFAGAVALIGRKGAGVHIGAGKLFVATMGASSVLGAILGLVDAANFYITFHAGILGTTLIASSWLAARAKDGRLDVATTGVSALNLVNAIALITLGVLASQSADGAFLGFAASSYFFLFGMTAFAVIGDASLLARRTLSRPHRIARHLWRMCLAFFIAAGSAFTGPGAAVFPDFVQASGVLALPELLILLTLLFWLAHTYWTGRQGR